VMANRPNRKLFLIDIAVPRDISPAVAELENVYLYNIDHLEKLIQATVRLREQELVRCGEIIDAHTAELMAKINFNPFAGADLAARDLSAECHHENNLTVGPRQDLGSGTD